MATTPIINIIATQCRPEVEEKFNRWYDEIHIPLLLKFKGIKEVTRYKIINETEEYPTYLTVYEFESQKTYEAFTTSLEYAAVREEMGETWKEGGFEIKWRVQYEPLKTWKR